MANGKKKGSKNERDLSKWFQDWSGLEFSRVPASGGLRWQKKDDISGDIICTDPRKSRRFPFSIEAKFYKDINFEHLILGNKKQKIIDFWEQAKEDGVRSKRIPLLFMRYNGMKKNCWFTIMHKSIYNKALKHGLEETNNAVFEVTIAGQEPFIILNSEDLKEVNFKDFSITIKKLLRHENKR